MTRLSKWLVAGGGGFWFRCVAFVFVFCFAFGYCGRGVGGVGVNVAFADDVVGAGVGEDVFDAEKCRGVFGDDDVVVDTVINYGNVEYKSVPHSQILKLDRLHNPERTRGVTVAGARVSYDMETERQKIDGGFCVRVKKIKFFVGYPMLSVMIDDKYGVGSCEYEAIKKHEKGHVAIYQRELKYYGGLILSDLRKMGEELPGMFFRKNVSDKAVRARLDAVIAKSPVMAVMAKLDAELKRQNSEYDNEAEYRRVQAECDEW